MDPKYLQQRWPRVRQQLNHVLVIPFHDVTEIWHSPGNGGARHLDIGSTGNAVGMSGTLVHLPGDQ